MKLSKDQVTAVMALPAQKRYEHFVKQVADSEEAWGLFKDGWAISSDSAGRQSLPIWCAREYAELSKLDEWREYQAENIQLDILLNEMLPDLALNSISLAVMYLPHNEGVVVSAEHVKEDIETELENY